MKNTIVEYHVLFHHRDLKKIQWFGLRTSHEKQRDYSKRFEWIEKSP
jgi:hypothetical protein